mmetsp:Transcript_30866/g.78120  ORF Transcript_30866/g.78120 Transcript_30866/m.78120 type:complete len:223 (-) Transcript_30866:1792-2460(-)
MALGQGDVQRMLPKCGQQLSQQRAVASDVDRVRNDVVNEHPAIHANVILQNVLHHEQRGRGSPLQPHGHHRKLVAAERRADGREFSILLAKTDLEVEAGKVHRRKHLAPTHRHDHVIEERQRRSAFLGYRVERSHVLDHPEAATRFAHTQHRGTPGRTRRLQPPSPQHVIHPLPNRFELGETEPLNATRSRYCAPLHVDFVVEGALRRESGRRRENVGELIG